MKILQVIPTLLIGGAERFVVEISNQLSLSHRCDVLTLYDGEFPLTEDLSSRVGRYSLSKKSGFDFGCFWRLYKFISSGSYNVVHIHVGAIKYAWLAATLLRNVRFVATIHSEAKREAGSTLDKWSRFDMFKHGKCTPVTISEQSEKSFKEFYGIDAKIVYNGVSPYVLKGNVDLQDNEDQLVFIHPASCQPIKNQALLFDAFARFVKECPNSKLLWIGANVSDDQFMESVKEHMIPQIEYLGPVSNVRDYLASADAMCLSSKMEGMPMVLIEAFSVGCIPICTPVGGIVNMIENNVNGFLSRGLTLDDYYDVLMEFSTISKLKRLEMKESSRKSFDKYSIESCAKGYLEVYAYDKK